VVAVSIVVSILTGFLLVRALWPGSTKWQAADWLRLPLGIWCGLGLSSLASFAVQLASPGTRVIWITVDGVMLAVALMLWAVFGRKAEAEVSNSKERSAWTVAKWTSLTGVAVMAIAYLLMALPRQTGEVDAWSIWNMKARFLYRGGSFATMADPLLTWIHPEFPYLLPSLVLRSWHWAGEESMTAPMLLAAVFVGSLAMAMYGAVCFLRTQTQGFLALAAILGSAGFVGNGAVQYADFPLAAFLFGALAAIAAADRLDLPRLLSIAGLCSGFASWTKFEGVFYAVALLAVAVWRLGVRSLLPFVAGAIPGVAMLVYFRMTLAPSIAAISADPILLLIAIASKLFTFQFLGWVVSPFLIFALYLYCMGTSKDRRNGWVALACLFVAGCLAIIVRDDNIGDAAAIRIVLHLWPAALFAVFLHANAPEELMLTTGKVHKASRK